MVITLPPQLETVLVARAKQRGITPEELATEVLQRQLEQPSAVSHEEWMRQVRALAVKTGYTVTDSAARNRALSSEGLYD
jgi:hypothetical protein